MRDLPSPPRYSVLMVWGSAGGEYTTTRTRVHNGEWSVPLRDFELLWGYLFLLTPAKGKVMCDWQCINLDILNSELDTFIYMIFIYAKYCTVLKGSHTLLYRHKSNKCRYKASVLLLTYSPTWKPLKWDSWKNKMPNVRRDRTRKLTNSHKASHKNNWSELKAVSRYKSWCNTLSIALTCLIYAKN